MSSYPNQTTITSTQKSAKSIDEAKKEALKELGISESEAIIEIIQEPVKGFLGIGAKDAIVKASVKNAPIQKTEEVKTEPVKYEESTVEPQPKAEQPVKKISLNGIYTSESPAENAKNFISDVLKAMGIEVNVSAVLEGDMVNINLEGDNMGIVIGKRGDTLDSLQYLTSLVVNQSSEDYIKITIDTENYREKRSEALITLSNRLAQKVIKTGKRFALEPMNPYERRIIHANLQDSTEVSTFSVGQEPYRKVVIAPKNPKPYIKKGYKGRGDRNDSRGNRSRRPMPMDNKSPRGGYSKPNYSKSAPVVEKPAAAEGETASTTYKADFKPQQHKAEYKNFEEYLEAHNNG